ncbi:aquaporin-8-like [Solea senegalensis]|uniref:Aquaporin-8-like n=1 Tax=Solea senegalensis TaxID=28829 RepID=A0AAV6RQE7_SOLSE|nr:aquaporin-8a.1 [Solea senegalensis]KAG7506445.1 aquaporin-8-like [Solea senegalensis]
MAHICEPHQSSNPEFSPGKVRRMSGAESNKTLEVLSVSEDEEQVMQSRGLVFQRYVQPCVAELLGTCLFVFVGCASVVGDTGTAGVLQPAVAHGLALGTLITVFGQISGGHLNPVVSLSVYLCGGMKLVLLLPYVTAQVLGAMIGAGLVKVAFPAVSYAAVHGAAFEPSVGDVGRATLAEVMMSTFLTTVVCMTAVNQRTTTPWAPFCIGLTVTANILAGGVLSGACMNPARAFGPAVAAGHWNHHWIYWVGPTCGALLTVCFVRFLFGDQNTRVVLK